VRQRRGSIGSQRAMGRGPHSATEVDASLMAIVDRVTRRMRAAHRVGRTITLRLRFDDFTRVTRSHTLTDPTAETALVLAAARGLLAAAMPLIRANGITLVGVSVSNLADERAIQLTLPFGRRDRSALDAALDAVRDRYGSGAVTRAALLGRSPGLEVPLLPD